MVHNESSPGKAPQIHCECETHHTPWYCNTYLWCNTEVVHTESSPGKAPPPATHPPLVPLQMFFFWFVFYGPSTHFRSLRARSVTLITLFLGKPPWLVYQHFVHILSPVNDNCASWISGRRRMAIEMFSWPSLHERMCRTWGSNSGLLACQADTPLQMWDTPYTLIW